jgi:predicted enzyme related to lactoylglutathione lyase
VSTIGSISAVRVYAVRFDETTRFYEQVLGLQASVCAPDMTLFRTGQCQLILERLAPRDPRVARLCARDTAISFDVADCRAACMELQSRGVRVADPPRVEDWGGIVARILDPEGNVLTLVQHP